MHVWQVWQIQWKIQELGVSRLQWPNSYICNNSGTRVAPRQFNHVKYSFNMSKGGQDDLILVKEAKYV